MWPRGQLKGESKYKAKAADGFRSKLERAVYDVLLIRQNVGEIRNIKREQSVVLQDGPKEVRINWKVDFSFEEKTRDPISQEVFWQLVYCEAKGKEMADYKIKLKLWRSKRPYPLEIWKGDYKRPKMVERIE